jgi:hypothetical protein
MTEEPKFIITQGTGYIETEWYDVDSTKLTSAKDIAELLTALEMRVSPTCKKFDKVKKFLIIPEEPKGIEYYQKELDEKFEKLIEQYKRNSYSSTLTTERNYDWNFDKIIGNFEYARENGGFKSKLDYTTLSVFGDGSNSISFTTQFRIGVDEVGYWDIKPNIKVYLEKKPNPIVRYFSKLLLDFEWKSTK